MLSSSGSASIAPMPRSIVRRGIARLEIIMACSSFVARGARARALSLGGFALASAAGALNGVLFTTPRMTDDQR